MRRFKPLLPLGGATVADHVIATLRGAGAAVFLVVGHRHDEITARIDKQDITIVYNPDYAQGMFSSIRAGIRRLPPAYRGFFVLPVDIPLVRRATFLRLMETAARSPRNIVYPVFRGKRGHPPLVPAHLAPAILGWGGEGGLKGVLAAREDLAVEVAVADGRILFDIDTPGDYRRLRELFRRDEVPTDAECREILNTICRVTPARIRHSRRVARAAVAIGRALGAAGIPVDLELVRAAALLHDVAKGQPKHDIAGGRQLREMGFGRTGDIVAVHSDLAGGDTGLPLESKVVFLADKLIKGETPVSLKKRYGTSLRPGATPEFVAGILERLDIAEEVKRWLEGLVGRPLEEII
jgi:molybdenum cofactor cytidylyltransferase